MNKKTMLCGLSLLLILALAVTAWLWAYHHRKSNDNLPSLASLSQMEEEEITDLLTGYRKEQLAEVWGEPQGTLFGMYGEIWALDDENEAYLIVYFTPKGIVEQAKIHTDE